MGKTVLAVLRRLNLGQVSGGRDQQCITVQAHERWFAAAVMVLYATRAAEHVQIRQLVCVGGKADGAS